MEHQTYEELLRIQNIELEEYKKKADNYEALLSDKQKFVKRSLGKDLWDDSMLQLPLDALMNLHKHYGRTE